MKKTFVVSLFSVYILFTSCSPLQEEGSSIAEPKAAKTKNIEWSYEGETGPAQWGELSPQYVLCKNGAEQSPLNIEEILVGVNDSLPELRINYYPTALSVNHNDQIIKVRADEKNNSITLGEKAYKLQYFYIHTQSEHQLNGQHYEMELQFVHEDKQGNLVALAVFVIEGTENHSFTEIIKNLSQDQESLETEVQLTHTVDLLKMLPHNLTTFRYEGSLTIPPCTERVRWLVLEKPIELSQYQIAAFQKMLSGNNRPIQPQNEREIAKK